MSRRRFNVREGTALINSSYIHIDKPQISMLGPLLSIMFMNDQPEFLGGAYMMFEDDVNLLPESDVRKNLQVRLDNFSSGLC